MFRKKEKHFMPIPADTHHVEPGAVKWVGQPGAHDTCVGSLTVEFTRLLAGGVAFLYTDPPLPIELAILTRPVHPKTSIQALGKREIHAIILLDSG